MYDDATNEFAYLFNSYEELTKLCAKLSYAYDARLSILRYLEELTLLSPFIILLIVIKNNHNLIDSNNFLNRNHHKQNNMGLMLILPLNTAI